MGDDLAEGAARLHDLRRQAVHLDVALVADDEPLRRIEQQQALRHVVDGGVQALLFQPSAVAPTSVLLRQLAHHQKQHGRRSPARTGRPPRSGTGFARASRPAPPIPSSSRRSTIGNLLSTRAAPSRSWPSIGTGRSAWCRDRTSTETCWKNGPSVEILSDHRIDMGIAGQQRAVAMEHRDRGAVAERQAGEEFLEIGRLDAPADDAEEFAVAARSPCGRSRWSRRR